MTARRLLTTAAALVTLSAAGAARAQTPAQAPAAQTPASVNDPWESTNRKLYNFNRTLDRVAVRPGVVFYHHATPTPVRNGLHNVLVNATHPVIIINDVLQLRPMRALNALGRFVINSTVGIGGVFDVAGNDFPYHNADFGLTMARYGVPTGPYLFVPILGPTTIRDGAGRIVDGVIDPLNSVNYSGREVLAPTRAVVGGVDARDRLDPLLKDLDRTATDPYATLRSAYFQNRAAQVRGEVTSSANLKALPDFGPAPAGATPPSSSTPGDAGAPSDAPSDPGAPSLPAAPGPSAALTSSDRVADLLAALPSAEGATAVRPVALAALN